MITQGPRKRLFVFSNWYLTKASRDGRMVLPTTQGDEMKTKTAEAIAAAIGESVAFVLDAEAKAVEDEADMCENCRDFLNECMADIQTVVNDDSISLSTRLSYTIMQCAIALAGASHGTMQVSEIFEKLYISSRLTEAEVVAKRFVEMIFGDMGAGDPSDPRNN